VSDPKAQALFETTAEALKGLEKAFDDFEAKREAAWTQLDRDRFLQEENGSKLCRDTGVVQANLSKARCGDAR
jgi:hypothetical protein